MESVKKQIASMLSKEKIKDKINNMIAMAMHEAVLKNNCEIIVFYNDEDGFNFKVVIKEKEND